MNTNICSVINLNYQYSQANRDLESNWCDTKAAVGPDGLTYMYTNCLQVFNLSGDLTTATRMESSPAGVVESLILIDCNATLAWLGIAESLVTVSSGAGIGNMDAAGAGAGALMSMPTLTKETGKINTKDIIKTLKTGMHPVNTTHLRAHISRADQAHGVIHHTLQADNTIVCNRVVPLRYCVRNCRRNGNQTHL